MPLTRAGRGRWGILLLLLLIVGLAALAVVGVVTAYEFRYADRIYPGVEVAGIPLAGLTLDEAAAAIKDGLNPYPGPSVTLTYGDRSWSLAPADLGLTVDAGATAAAAYAVGRQGLLASSGSLSSFWPDLRADLMTQWAALREGYSISPTLRFDEGRLIYTLKRIARAVDVPPVEGGLQISGLEVSAVPGRVGRQVNLDATRAALIQVARAGRGGEVPLVVEERRPAVISAEQAAAEATALLGRSLILVATGLEGRLRFAVDRAILRQWLRLATKPASDGTVELTVELDREQVMAYLQEMAAQMDRPARDALLDFDPNARRVIVLSPSQVGQELDIQAGLEEISTTLLDRVAASVSQEITLPVKLIQPRIDSTRIAEMGIVEQVSEGTTYFAGSSRDRVHNIATAAEKFRGVVIPPDEEFSFNRYVGEITAANGFVEGLIIGAERTAVGIGGGVCQVSTTVFRAAFFGGFPITERWAHGYVVSWYGEPGLDATIYTPDVDFRFRNDTGHYLLIRPEVDTTKGRITFYFYGTKPARRVEMSKPAISNVRKPEKPIYQEDPSLAKGVIKQVDWAKDGMDVVVKRTIRYGDGRVKEEEFVSKYQPWRAVFLYGPGTSLPPGALDQPAVR